MVIDLLAITLSIISLFISFYVIYIIDENHKKLIKLLEKYPKYEYSENFTPLDLTNAQNSGMLEQDNEDIIPFPVKNEISLFNPEEH
jgi:hypothetical protein